MQIVPCLKHNELDQYLVVYSYIYNLQIKHDLRLCIYYYIAIDGVAVGTHYLVCYIRIYPIPTFVLPKHI